MIEDLFISRRNNTLEFCMRDGNFTIEIRYVVNQFKYGYYDAWNNNERTVLFQFKFYTL